MGHSREGHSGKERGDKEQSNRLVEADLAHTGAVLQSREQGTDHQGKDDMDHDRGLENGRMAGQVGQAALGEQSNLGQCCGGKLGSVFLLELGQELVTLELLGAVDAMLLQELGQVGLRVRRQILSVALGKVLVARRGGVVAVFGFLVLCDQVHYCFVVRMEESIQGSLIFFARKKR